MARTRKKAAAEKEVTEKKEIEDRRYWKHQAVRSKSRAKKHDCPRCGKTFSRRNVMQRHLDEVCGQEKKKKWSP